MNPYLKYILQGTAGYFGVILYVTITRKLRLNMGIVADLLLSYIFLIFLCLFFAWIELKWERRR